MFLLKQNKYKLSEEESDNKEVDKKNPKHSAVVFAANFNEQD